MGSVEIVCFDRYEFDLYGPLAQLRLCDCRRVGKFGGSRLKRHGCLSGAAVRKYAGLAAGTSASMFQTIGFHISLYGGFVIGSGFALYKGNGVRRAVGQAVA